MTDNRVINHANNITQCFKKQSMPKLNFFMATYRLIAGNLPVMLW